MKNVCNSRGLMLIELLVVVFIIGILLSVTLSTYGKLLQKSHSEDAKMMMKSTLEDMDVYYITQGEYTYDSGIINLNADSPSGFCRDNSFSIKSKTGDTTLIFPSGPKGYKEGYCIGSGCSLYFTFDNYKIW